jgi:hypothetical protein
MRIISNPQREDLYLATCPDDFRGWKTIAIEQHKPGVIVATMMRPIQRGHECIRMYCSEEIMDKAIQNAHADAKGLTEIYENRRTNR